MMDHAEFEKKLANINEVEPDEEDLKAIALIENGDQTTMTKEELEAERAYNGRVSLRLPKSLHRELVQEAKAEGISLNQFILYKLAK